MPSVPSISFNVRFDLTGAPSLLLTDTTTYPVGAIGIFTVTQPDGYVRTGNFATPDVTSSGGTFSTNLRLSSTGGVQCGTYIIKYEIRTTDDVISTFTRNFVFQYEPVNLIMKENFDVFTPNLSYSDSTNYSVSGYSNTAPTRSWTAVSIPTGTKTSTTAAINLQHNGSYYDAMYTITLASSLLYSHQTYAWLSVQETISKTVTAEACTPEPIEDLIPLIEALRQRSIECNGDFPDFEKAQTLFSHLTDMLKVLLIGGVTQEGIYDVYEDLLVILRNNQTIPCVHTNLPIPPYDLGDYAVSQFPIDAAFCTTVGDGVNTVYSVTHNLNDDCVLVQVYEVTSGAQVLTDVTITSNNSVNVSFAAAPASNAYKVVVHSGNGGMVGPGLEAGGTVGQFLRKQSATDYDTYWDTLDAGDIPSLDMSKIATGNLSWSRISATPTTLSGYGITDPVVLTSGSYSNPVWLTSLAWSKITSTPTSLSGYGITDPVVLTSGSYSNPSWITGLAWSKITGAPGFLTSETDPVFTAHPAFGITGTKISNWDSAYGFTSAFPSQSGNGGRFLTTDGNTLSWANVVSGVSSFNTRTGAVTLNSSDVTIALGYTPYNSTNPSGYITGINAADVITALGYTPVTSARTLTINGTSFDLSADRSWTVSGNNIYNADGTLTGNRTVTMGTNTLSFTKDLLVNGITVGIGSFGDNNNYNTVLGWRAMPNSTTKRRNTAIGSESLTNATTGSFNTAVGNESLYALTTGTENTAVGDLGLDSVTTGAGNVSLGAFAMRHLVTGNYNIGIGYDTNLGVDTTAGSYNTLLGAQSTIGDTSGSNNTVLGARINASGNYSNNIILGDGSGNMRLVFNSSGDAVLGGSTTYPTFSGFKLDVLGSGRFSGNLTTNVTANSIVKTNASGVLTAAIAGTDYVTSNIYTADGTLTGNRTVTNNAFTLTVRNTSNTSAPLILQNTQTYGTGGVFTQYTQQWLTSTGTNAGFVLGDIGRLVMTNMVQAPQFFVGSLAGIIDAGVSRGGSIGINGAPIDFGTATHSGGGQNIGRWFGTGNLLIQTGGTFADAGFKLDVQGTARVTGTTRFDNSVEFRSTNGNNKFTIAANTGWTTQISTGSFGSAALKFGDGAFANLLIGQSADTITGQASLDLRSNSLGFYPNRGTIATMPNLSSWGGVSLSIVGGSGYINGSYNGVVATGNYFGSVNVNVTVSSGSVTAISLFGGDVKVQLGETFTIPAASIGGTGSGMSFTITAINNINPAFTFYNTTTNLLTYWDGRNYASPIVSKLDRVLIGGSGLANSTSILELSSTTQGFLPPRMTETQRNAIASPATGLSVYNTTTNTSDFYNGTSWVSLAAGNIYTANGTLTSNRTINSGGFDLIFTGTDTASAGQARFIQMTPTLVAVSNNDVLVGLDINPTFTNGAFTNVTNAAIRIQNGPLQVGNTSNFQTYINSRASITDFLFRANYGVAAQMNLTLDGTGFLNMTGANFSAPNITVSTNLQTNGSVIFNGNNKTAYWVNVTDQYVMGMSGNTFVIRAASSSLTTGGALVSTSFANGNISFGGTTDAGFKLDVQGTLRITGTTTAAAVNGTTANFSGNAAFGSTTQIAIGGNGGFGGGASYWLQVVSNNLTLNATGNASSSVEFIGTNQPLATYTGRNSAISQSTVVNNYSAGIDSYYNQFKAVLNATGNAFANTMYVRGFFVDSGTLTANSSTLIPIGFENVSGTNLFNSTSGSTLFGAQYGSLNASAKVQINSTTQGFLPPRMTSAQRTAISTPAVGLIVYQTDSTEGTYEYTSSGWRLINAAGTGGSGTVTSVSVVSANGFAGTVANNTTTPAITLSTTITGLIKGNGTALSAAVAGTDYLTPSDVTYSVANVTTTYSETATKGTRIIKGDTTGGAFTITLPTAVGNTATIIIKKVAGSGALTVDGAGSETIDGGTTATIIKVNESITLVSDNTNWQIV